MYKLAVWYESLIDGHGACGGLHDRNRIGARRARSRQRIRATGTLSRAPARQVITFVSRGTMEHRARHAKLIAAPVGPRLKAREKRAVATQNSQAGADWRFMGRASRHWRARSPRSQQGG